MIKNIKIKQYRKLKQIDLNFDTHINVISGTNGTCKTSLLHIISNSFQKINKKDISVECSVALDVLRTLNAKTNSKIEDLTKGDKVYNDPAKGIKGTLYSVEYEQCTLEFRRHNSKKEHRFSIKPKYKKNSGEKLPKCPVIYLGLPRLFPVGEVDNKTIFFRVKNSLPIKYLNQIKELYKELTDLDILDPKFENFGNFKKRVDFQSQKEGVDSNTISAGEDNILMLLIALISICYYVDSLKIKKEVNGILIIDEIDATLHPNLQVKLLRIFNDYSYKYGIQMFFTSHSISFLEEALKLKNNVNYLVDNETDVILIEEVDIYKIRMYLNNVLQTEIYKSKKIPVYTEDDEARLFLQLIFEYFCEIHKMDDFMTARSYFGLLEINVGADNLKKLFGDKMFKLNNSNSICILDGDQQENKGNCIIVLPGGKSPEKLIFEHLGVLINEDGNFWREKEIMNWGYTKKQVRDNAIKDINEIRNRLNKLEEENKSKKGKEREFNKEVFKKHEDLFVQVAKNWIVSSQNRVAIDNFYASLYSMFRKTAAINEISPNIWKRSLSKQN